MRKTVNATPRPLQPRERDRLSILQEAGWDPVQVWTGVKNLASDPLTLHPLASRYTDCAVAAHSRNGKAQKNAMACISEPDMPLNGTE